MFNTMIDLDTIKEIRNFLDSDKCKFVENMNRAGLSFNAMALVIHGIETICDDMEKELTKEI